MSLKMELVTRAKAGESLTALCKEFGISRPTGHKWFKRYKEGGYDGLDEQSRRPKSTPLTKGEDVVMAVLDVREKHPRWGPSKLAPLLRRSLGADAPSERTIARILQRAGKIRQRRTRRELSVIEKAPQVEAKAPNDVWTIDFKGWWRTRDGARIEPLTVRDAFSRYVLLVKLPDKPVLEWVQKELEALFRKYGTPSAMKCDNGEPFVAVHARAGLSSLSAWWTALGIQLVRSRPGCPQDNGAHERMHADLKADVQKVEHDNAASAQRALSKWRQEFNHVRPHAALNQRTPADVYKPQERRAPVVLRPSYPPDWRRLRVGGKGEVCLRGCRLFISRSLRGYEVGLEPITDLRMRVWFHKLDLGEVKVEPVVTNDVIEEWMKKKKRTAA